MTIQPTKATVAWTIFALAVVLSFAIFPLGPEGGALADVLFVLQVLTALVGLGALTIAIRSTMAARR